MATFISMLPTAVLIAVLCLSIAVVDGQNRPISPPAVKNIEVQDIDESNKVQVDINPCLDGCRFDNSLGYVADPFDCSRFYQCVLGRSGFIDTAHKKCPTGLFWDQRSVTCVRPQRVQCDADKCRSSPRGFYMDESNCNAYWACSGGKSSEMRCCQPGTTFNLISGQCEVSTCTDICPLRRTRRDDFVRICDKYALDSNPNIYLEQPAGYPFALQMRCPSGLGFNNFTCNCDIPIKTPVAKPKCNPEVYLPLDRNFRDQSGKHTYIEHDGAAIRRFNIPPGTVGEGSAFFDGRSFIRIPRFSNAYMGTTLKISFRYLPVDAQFSSNARRMEALVTNSGCDSPATVAIAFDRFADGTFCSVDTKGKGNMGNLLPASVRTDSWRDVTYIYDGNQLRLEVNADTDVSPAFGVISTSRHSLKIGGQCDTFNGFTGFIDEVRIFQCLEQ